MQPIKIKPEKIKKAPSRTMKSSDEDYDVIRRLVCDLYIANQNMSTSYDLFRRATMGDDYVKIASNSSTASAFFNKPENQNYIEKRRAEIAKAGFDEYCKMKNIEHAEFTSVKEKEYQLIANLSPSEIREKNYIELEMLKDITLDPQIRATIIKQQTELMDAKLKDKSIELTAEDKLIHYYLPAPYCDTCPNRKIIEEQYAHLPEIDLHLDETNDESTD